MDPWGFPLRPTDPSEIRAPPTWVKAVASVLGRSNPLAVLRVAGPWGESPPGEELCIKSEATPFTVALVHLVSCHPHLFIKQSLTWHYHLKLIIRTLSLYWRFQTIVIVSLHLHQQREQNDCLICRQIPKKGRGYGVWLLCFSAMSLYDNLSVAVTITQSHSIALQHLQQGGL